MKYAFVALIMNLAFMTQVANAGPAQTLDMSAELLYQQGLYFQHTLGKLDIAIDVYDQALALASKKEKTNLLDSIHLRRIECLDLLDRSEEHKNALIALKRHSSEPGTVDPSKYFPAQTDLMFQIDLEALKASALFKRLMILNKDDQNELKELTSILGFDPLKMLQNISVALSLSDDLEMPLEYWLVLGEGDFKQFQPGAIIKTIKEQASQMSKGEPQKNQKDILGDIVKKNIHGTKVWSTKVVAIKHQRKPMNIGLAKMDDRTVVIGDMVSIRHFLSARAGKSPGLIANKKLHQLGPLVPKGSTFWLAAVPKDIMMKFDDIKKSLGTANLPSLDTILLSGRVDQDLRATAVAWATNNESAKKLSAIARGLIALGQMVSTEEPLVDKLLQSLKVETKERQVTISVVLPGDLMAQSAELGKAPKPPKRPKPASTPKKPKPVTKP